MNDVENRKKAFSMLLEGRTETQIAKELNMSTEEVNRMIEVFTKIDILRKELIVYYIKQRNMGLGRLTKEIQRLGRIKRDITNDVYELIEEGVLKLEEIPKEEYIPTFKSPQKPKEKIKEEIKEEIKKPLRSIEVRNKRDVFNNLHTKILNGKTIETEEVEEFEILVAKTGYIPIDVLELADVYRSQKDYDKAIKLIETRLADKSNSKLNETYKLIMEERLKEIRSIKNEQEREEK